MSLESIILHETSLLPGPYVVLPHLHSKSRLDEPTGTARSVDASAEADRGRVMKIL